MSTIFVSHDHNDVALVEALAKLFETLFEGTIEPLNYSSDKDPRGGGIDPGEDWFEWIVKQVRDAKFVFIVLTPNSALKPWVIWEAGAAAGAAMSGEAGAQRPLYPIVYGMDGAEVPGALERRQRVKGDRREGIEALISSIFEKTKADISPDALVRYGEARKGAIDTYLEAVDRILPRLPIAVTEPALQEWIDRLDGLRAERRQSEAKVLERWIDIAFGRNEPDKDPPLDLRVHRRLAELYQAAGKSVPGALADAERQYEYARTMAPRDILILRGLGRVKLDRGDMFGCEKVIEQIEELDGESFLRNPENAALKARFFREKGNRSGEIAVLKDAYGNMPESYYIGDLWGQALLEADRTDEAKEVYRKISEEISASAIQNIWSTATRLTASLVTNDEAAVRTALVALEDFKPDAGVRQSIMGGIERISARLQLSEAVTRELNAFGRT